MSDERINVNVGAHTQNLEQGMKRAGESVAHGTAYMRESFKGLGELVERIKVPLVSFFALFEGGELFKDAIQQTEQLGVQLTVLSQKTGMAVEDLSKLQFAAKASHVDAGALDVGLRQLARSMEESLVTKTAMSARAFQALGISVKDSNGHTKTLHAILGEVADKFAHYADGAQKTAIAQALFGRSGSDLIPVLDKGSAGIKDLGDEAERLGAVMTGPQAEAAAKYEDGMMKMHEATQGLVRVLVVGILPAMTSAAEKTAALIAKLKDCTNAAVALAAAIGTAGLVAALRAASTMIIGTEIGAFAKLAFTIRSVGDATAFASLGWGKLVGMMSGGLGVIGLAAATVGILAYDIQEVADAIDATEAADEKIPAAYLKALGRAHAHGRGHYVMRHGKRVWVKEGEDTPTKPPAPDFKDDTGTEKEQAIESPAMKALQKRLAEQQKAWTKYFAAVKKANDENDKELTETTAANQKSEQTYLDRQLKAIREHNKQSAEDYQKTLDKIAGQWAHAFNVITDTVKKSVDGMIQGTLTMRMAWENLGRNLVLSFASSELQMVQQHAAAELAKRHITEQSVLQRIALETYGAVRTIAVKFAEGVAWIAVEAAKAAAGAWSALVGIPFVGPFIAPAAAAATLAGVLALAGTMKSAAGGYDVPAGLNPMTQLHAQEMVLPKEYANVIRGMAQGGGGGGNTYVTHIHAMDAKSFKEFATTHRDTIADVTRRAHKEGRLDHV